MNRHRWGIENGFKKLKHVIVRTTSTEREYRCSLEFVRVDIEFQSRRGFLMRPQYPRNPMQN